MEEILSKLLVADTAIIQQVCEKGGSYMQHLNMFRSSS